MYLIDALKVFDRQKKGAFRSLVGSKAGLEPFPYRGVSLIVVCSLIPNFRFITCSQFSKARLPPDDQECRALPQLSSHLLLFIFTTHFIKRKRRRDWFKEGRGAYRTYR